jgi:hypothetical protein
VCGLERCYFDYSKCQRGKYHRVQASSKNSSNGGARARLRGPIDSCIYWESYLLSNGLTSLAFTLNGGFTIFDYYPDHIRDCYDVDVDVDGVSNSHLVILKFYFSLGLYPLVFF